ncbi:hypothetical protein DKT77_14450 [Meridianimarinicoccus roseus]|uniref:Secreted protein n=1 Tax=Meridianimarinicoccus roseus TaxID=2072018 RepID=A0A2V2LHF3_9RHOB|nr:VPLPA-CTERM sorting domain-containing protein [Meridianimarinicoccus roseus]PWR01799.1 hypothetical protein DKT77_14450 [Meridianimarinicoccus roseus]
MKNLRAILFSATMVTAAFTGAVNAAPTTLTFDDPFGPVASYVEAGMTITQVTGSLVGGGNGVWDVPCCPSGADAYDLTTGGLFNLISIDIVHSDAGDPITFSGYNGATLVSDFTVNSNNFGALVFAGFIGLDRVRITATGSFTDPTFDNLTYEATAPVPLPAGLPLIFAGLGALGFAGRRKT